MRDLIEVNSSRFCVERLKLMEMRVNSAAGWTDRQVSLCRRAMIQRIELVRARLFGV
jgi:hypothetical protein